MLKSDRKQAKSSSPLHITMLWDWDVKPVSKYYGNGGTLRSKTYFKSAALLYTMKNFLIETFKWYYASFQLMRLQICKILNWSSEKIWLFSPFSLSKEMNYPQWKCHGIDLTEQSWWQAQKSGTECFIQVRIFLANIDLSTQ